MLCTADAASPHNSVVSGRDDVVLSLSSRVLMSAHGVGSLSLRPCCASIRFAFRKEVVKLRSFLDNRLAKQTRLLEVMSTQLKPPGKKMEVKAMHIQLKHVMRTL